MSHHRETLEMNYIDTEFSSGDSKKMKSKHYQEENNNEVDELSKELSEMGCIVDAAKKPPNCCLENCVYEEPEADNDNHVNFGNETNKPDVDNEEDAYSDEFEEDKSEDEEEALDNCAPKSDASDESRDITIRSAIKLTKSQSSMSSDKPPPSISGRSSGFGSASGLRTRRINMSFTNERLREIERHNHILLTKILSARNTRKCSIPPREQPVRKPVPSAAVCRKNQQRQIDHDNMILLKKIQRAKSSACSIRR